MLRAYIGAATIVVALVALGINCRAYRRSPYNLLWALAVCGFVIGEGVYFITK